MGALLRRCSLDQATEELSESGSSRKGGPTQLPDGPTQCPWPHGSLCSLAYYQQLDAEGSKSQIFSVPLCKCDSSPSAFLQGLVPPASRLPSPMSPLHSAERA